MKTLYLIELFKKGGPVMYPILACSIVMVAVAIERFWNLRKNKILPLRFVNDILGLIREDKHNDALIYCKTNGSNAANILASILEHYMKKEPDLRRIAARESEREFLHLDRFTPILSAVTGLAPLLGFYGTVIGMVQVFYRIESMGSTNIKFLSGGIYTAIITTAFGLTVAIPSFVVTRYFEARINSLISEIDEFVDEILNLLSTSKRVS